MIKLPFSQKEHLQIFPTCLTKKKYALPYDFALESNPKNIFTCQRDVENYTNQVLDILFYDRHEYIYTESSGL